MPGAFDDDDAATTTSVKSGIPGTTQENKTQLYEEVERQKRAPKITATGTGALGSLQRDGENHHSTLAGGPKTDPASSASGSGVSGITQKEGKHHPYDTNSSENYISKPLAGTGTLGATHDESQSRKSEYPGAEKKHTPFHEGAASGATLATAGAYGSDSRRDTDVHPGADKSRDLGIATHPATGNGNTGHSSTGPGSGMLGGVHKDASTETGSAGIGTIHRYENSYYLLQLAR